MSNQKILYQIRPLFQAPDKISYLDGARAVAKWLLDVSIRTPEGLTWPKLVDVDGILPKEDPESGLTFYAGNAGIIFYFVQLYAAVREEEYLNAALDGIRYIRAQQDDEFPYGFDLPEAFSKWSFSSGLSGILYPVIELLKVYEDKELEAFVKKLVDKLVKGAVKAEVGKKWTGRAAYDADGGTIMFLLYAAEYFQESSWVETAAKVGEYLLTTARKLDDGHISYDNGYYKQGIEYKIYWPNFEHGDAGAAYAFARLYEATGREEFLKAADEAAEYLTSIAVVQGDGALIPYRYPDLTDVFYLGYCHGPAGTGRLFYLLYKLTGKESYKEWLDRLVQGVIDAGAPENHSEGYWNVYSQCCGTAGIVNLFLGLWADNGEQKYLELANRGGRHIIGAAKITKDPYMYWLQSYTRIRPALTTYDTGFQNGAAGIGTALLQLYLANQNQFQVSRLPNDPFPKTSLTEKG
ncbi:MAG: hypothetical protein IJ390_14770 [Lachnospiraceae bacterium]|nr:hypothetical protein [Lachnospiraceae bacterium]